jgi:hypothetical protein
MWIVLGAFVEPFNRLCLMIELVRKLYLLRKEEDVPGPEEQPASETAAEDKDESMSE